MKILNKSKITITNLTPKLIHHDFHDILLCIFWGGIEVAQNQFLTLLSKKQIPVNESKIYFLLEKTRNFSGIRKHQIPRFMAQERI